MFLLSAFSNEAPVEKQPTENEAISKSGTLHNKAVAMEDEKVIFEIINKVNKSPKEID